MAGRRDGDNYGKLLTFTFPKDRLVYGPEQIEARITADERIGRELSLLCPEGKKCIRGNLLVIPIGETVLYVEPLFIQSQALRLPELKKVFAADANRVVMGDSLEESLRLLLEGSPTTKVVGAGTKDTSVPRTGVVPQVPGTTPGAAQEQIAQIQRAIEELRKTLDALEDALERLD